MAEKTLHSLKSNATRLGQRLGENLAEHSRDLGLIDSFASGSGGGSGKYLENGTVVTATGIEETKRMLASRRESERTEGLKRVTAMMIKDLPVTAFFPLVTSLLTPSTPLASRTLISLYIIHCASTAPELALLSINAYQKDLSDPQPLVRAGAIKTLAAMALPDIRSLVGVAVTKGARDTAWYVRRATADAVRALWRADETYENRTALLPTVIVLLNTASPLTIGSALEAWEAVCPARWDLLHPGYRKWCRMLMDVEEWGQCVLLRVLLRYARTFFVDPRTTAVLDPDLQLLLMGSEQLLQHLNPAVVSGVIKLHYYLAPPARLTKIIRPLLRLLDSSPEVQALALEDCAVIADERPDLLAPYAAEFFVRFSEPLVSKRVRLRILVALASEANVRVLLNEFLIYVKDVEDSFSSDAIAAIGICAQRVPAVAPECLQTLIKLTQSKNDVTIAQAVLVLRSLLRSRQFPATASRTGIIGRLVVLLEGGTIKAPLARANVYWLVGQFAAEGLLESVGPDAVRSGAKGFAEESDTAKLQILTLSAKLLVLSHLAPLTPHLRALALLFTYLTTLARYDLTYEVRDRSRFLKGLLSSAGVGVVREEARLGLSEEDFVKGVQLEEQVGGEVEERTMTGEQVRAVLFDGKEGGDSLGTERATAELGSFALALPSKRLAFSSPLPAFPTTAPPSTLRDVLTVDSLKSPSSFSSSPSRSPTPLRGFGSDSRGSGRASPVVLVPTNFASGQEEGESASSGAPGRKGGFVVLEDFYASEEEGEGEEEEGESEEDEDSEEESEEESEGEDSSEDEEIGAGSRPR